jgi:hypothetical protein
MIGARGKWPIPAIPAITVRPGKKVQARQKRSGQAKKLERPHFNK